MAALTRVLRQRVEPVGVALVYLKTATPEGRAKVVWKLPRGVGVFRGRVRGLMPRGRMKRDRAMTSGDGDWERVRDSRAAKSRRVMAPVAVWAMAIGSEARSGWRESWRL